MTRGEVREHVRKMLIAQGMRQDAAAEAAGTMPDEVADAISEAGGVDVELLSVEELESALASREGHLPGCGGDHSLSNGPDVGIVMRDDPDAPDQIGEHGLGNIYVIIKAMLTWVATSEAMTRRFKDWMEDCELQSGTQNHLASRRISQTMLAFIAKAMISPHPDCPIARGEQCDKQAVVGGRTYKPEGFVPEAFRKPRFSAGNGEVADGGEPVIDPRDFRIDF